MFENTLSLHNISYGKKITYKTLVSAGLIILAVVLPQILHITLGQAGGVKFLPMYLPILIGGCFMGVKWGISVGILSPLISFLLTSVIGSPMPSAERLPFMMAELAVFAAVSGTFTRKISENCLWAFPAVILAQISGRSVFLGLAAVMNSFVDFTPAMIWEQIKNGTIGLIIQTVLVPTVMIILKKLMIKDNKND